MRAAAGKGRSTRRARRPSVSGDAAIVEGRPDLRITPENEEAVVEILAEILLDAPRTPAASARLDRIAGAS